MATVTGVYRVYSYPKPSTLRKVDKGLKLSRIPVICGRVKPGSPFGPKGGHSVGVGFGV